MGLRSSIKIGIGAAVVLALGLTFNYLTKPKVAILLRRGVAVESSSEFLQGPEEMRIKRGEILSADISFQGPTIGNSGVKKTRIYINGKLESTQDYDLTRGMTGYYPGGGGYGPFSLAADGFLGEGYSINNLQQGRNQVRVDAIGGNGRKGSKLVEIIVE